MADEKKTYTLEDVRAAFVDGAEWELANLSERDYNRTRANEIAARRYPSPKKLREVKYRNVAYRVKDGVVEIKTLAGGWTKIDDAAYYTTLADLIAHPFEDDK